MRTLIGCVLLSVSVVAQDAVKLSPQRIVLAGPATIQVTVKGDGEPIVFVPSRGRGIEDFDDLSTRLVQAGFQVILPQPRGVGGSTGPLEGVTHHDLALDLATTIREVVGGPVTVVGHAFGTRIARTLAADHPTLVKRLILLAVPGPIERAEEFQKVRGRVFDATLPNEERMAQVQRTFFAKGNDASVWREGWYLKVGQAQRAADDRSPLTGWWSGGSAPMLLVQGTEDVITPPENARRLAAEFPQRVTLVEIARAGHALLPEQPDQVAQAVLSYLR